MIYKNEARRAATQAGGQRSGAAGDVRLHPQSTTAGGECQQPNAPDGALPVYWRDGMIWCAGKHLCAVRGGALHRTFDAARECFRGGLSFRVDVLRLAVEHGAVEIVATERTTGQTWRIDMADFRAHGGAYRDLRFGAQWYCGFAHWTTSTPEPEPTGPVQLSMFGQAVR
jgi:hypothetical protein